MQNPVYRLPLLLLLDREAFWRTLRERGASWAEIATMAAFIVATCAVYGAVMAFWRSPMLAFFSAAKLPFVFIGSTAIVAVFNWMIATVLGSGLSFRKTVALTFASMVVACWILLAFAPVALVLSLTGVPKAGEVSANEVDFAYRIMLLTQVIVLAIAGVAGNTSLYNGLRAVVRPNCPAAALFLVWNALFAIVGCQMSWILRPFVGNPFWDVVFLRENALYGNFFEFVYNCLVLGLF
jgi:hypothetical protein